ncbi:hypothetical protein SBDP1_610025 [Syntrophobacter sp. SbD1]|nr:hypothetical protein SBDP1_610025 [Syntrophobacter sp. SbD1]
MRNIVVLLPIQVTPTPSLPFADAGNSSWTFHPVNYPGAALTVPQAVNLIGKAAGYAGTIVGFYYNDGWHGFYTTDFTNQATFVSIDYPGAASTIPGTGGTLATSINDSGCIVGYWTDSRGGVHGFIYDNSGAAGFDCLDAAQTHPIGINDANAIVGRYLDGNGNSHGFYTTDPTDPASFAGIDYPGASQTLATALNNHGLIVGHYQAGKSASHGFIYNHTTGVYTGFDYPRAIATFPSGVNDNGRISGYYTDNRGGQHGFFWPPFTTIDYPGSTSGTNVFTIGDADTLPGVYNDVGFVALSSSPAN